MHTRLLTCMALAATVLCSGAALAQGPSDDPFGGGFPLNYSPEVFTMGSHGDSLQGWAFDWLSDLDSIVMVGTDGFPESYACGLIRDIAAADFDGDYLDEVVVAWNRADGGVFVGIPTIDPATMTIDPGGWFTPSPPCAAGVLFDDESLADILGEIRVVAGNFYDDPAMEFVLAYLASDGTVSLSVFDVDDATLIPVEKGTISDQTVNAEVPEQHRFGSVSRFDVATGDFDGDGLDEIVLVVNDAGQSPATDLMVDVYDYDTLSHAIVPISKIPVTVNSDVDHTCLRRVLVSTGNFDPDSLDEIVVMDDWARTDVDSSRVGAVRVLKLDQSMESITYDQESLLPSCSWDPSGGMDSTVNVLCTYNGELIAGGLFSAAGGVRANNIARWNGNCWRPLGSGTNGSVRALAEYDGDLIVGGHFTEAGGVSVNYIARWDGSTWEPIGSGMNHYVLTLSRSDHGGDIFAGGHFTTADGVPANHIARWDGSDWQPLGTGTNAPVATIAAMMPDIIYVGGNFTTAGGVSANYFAQWDNGTWSNGGSSGFNSYVSELEYHYLRLYGGGYFTAADGYSCNHVARYYSFGWRPRGAGMNGNVYALKWRDDIENLFAGGVFSTAGGVSVNNIARMGLDADTIAWYPLGSGLTHSSATAVVCDLFLFGSELIAAGNFNTAGGVTVGGIARWNGSEWDSFHSRKYLSANLVAGNLLVGSDLDDIIITGCRDSSGIIEQYIRVYGIDTVSYPPELCLIWDTTIADAAGTAEVLSRSRRTVATGDFTGEGQPDVAMLIDDNDSSRIQVYEPYPDTSSSCVMDSVVLRGSWATATDNLSELVLADIDTFTVTIGPPRAYHIDSVIQPLAIINAPPAHYDILDDTVWDVSNRYPLPPDPDYDTYVEYYNSTGFVITTETEMHRDWGVSVGLETWASAGGFDVSAYLETSYGEGFSQQGGYTEQITVGATITAKDDDQLHAVRVGYDILEYPVIRAGEQMGNIVVASPSQTSQGWSPGKSYESLIPNHEVENVFSYPRREEIENNPMMASGIIGDAADFYTMQAASMSQWYLGQQTFTQSSVTTSWDLSVAAGGSFGYEGGFSIFGLGFSAGFEVSLEASYAIGQVSTFSTSFSDTDSLHVQMGLINSSGSYSGNRQYEVTPYAYWAKNGALVIDYAVAPIVNQPGHDPTWWQIHYSNPDPAFFLPWRLDNEKYGATDPEESRYRTKEIAFIPGYPAPGDTVLISARVHNFSLVPTPNPVAVSFYLGNPDNGGVLLTDKNSGDSIFIARDTSGAPIPIGAQREAIAEMVWQVPYVGSISGCQRIWALIDPLDSISPEVHDNDDWPTNNKGWKLLYVNTDDICIDRDGDGWEESTFRCHTCPHPQYSLGEQGDNCPTVYNPDQTDTDGDGIGDACEECCMPPMRGNVDYDTGDVLDISDLVYLVDYMFTGGPAPVCPEEANVDASCCASGTYETLSDIDISDLVYLVDYMFTEGPPPIDCP